MATRTAFTRIALQHLVARQELPVTVVGDCMEPLICPGARVLVSRNRFYWPGDVILFEDHRGRFLAHRLLGFFRRRKQLFVLAQADKASRPDVIVPTRHIIGRVTGGQCGLGVTRVPITHRVKAIARLFRFVLSRVPRRPHGFR